MTLYLTPRWEFTFGVSQIFPKFTHPFPADFVIIKNTDTYFAKLSSKSLLSCCPPLQRSLKEIIKINIEETKKAKSYLNYLNQWDLMHTECFAQPVCAKWKFLAIYDLLSAQRFIHVSYLHHRNIDRFCWFESCK